MQNDLHLNLPGFHLGGFIRRWSALLPDSIQSWLSAGSGDSETSHEGPQQVLPDLRVIKPVNDKKEKFLAGEVFKIAGDNSYFDIFKYQDFGLGSGSIGVRLFASDGYRHYCTVKEITDDRFNFMVHVFGCYIYFGTLCFDHLLFLEGGEWK